MVVAAATINFEILEYINDDCSSMMCSFYFLFNKRDMRIKDSEIFAIGCGAQFGMDEYDVVLLYSPMKEELALIDKGSLSCLLSYAENKSVLSHDEVKDLYDSFHHPQVAAVPTRNVMLSDRLSIIPNLTCNFSCSYCYSANGRSSKVMKWETAKSALDFFIDRNRINSKHLSLFISGGGEPLASWSLTKRIIEYARERSVKYDFCMTISVITNGSLITPEIADVMRENSCIVGVSFEVLEDLQNLQRKMWQKVSSNIHMLNDHGVTVKMNSTITPTSVNRMEEMLRTVAREYSFIAEYTMEPVTSVDLFGNAEQLGAFYDKYFDSYVKCSEQAKKMQLNLRFTFDDVMRGITPRHCPGKFCITPDGKISVCHLVSSPKEDRFPDCIYGEVTESGVIVDEDKFKHLYDINVMSYDRCRDCFAKWDCGGECMTRNAIYPESYLAEVCKFNKRFVRHSLVKKVAETIYNEYGMTLEEYVAN